MGFWFSLFIIALIFYALTKGYAKSPAGSAHKGFSEQDASFLVALLARIAKADGAINESEARYISGILDMCEEELKDPGVRARLKRIFDEQKNSQTSIEQMARMYKSARFLTNDECSSVIIYLLHLAYANGSLHPNEKRAIDEVARGFNLGDISSFYASFEREFSRSWQSSSSWNSRNSSFENEPKIDPYEVLGVSKEASFAEIKKKYRELSRKHHPDFLGARASSDEVAKATKKTQEINKAYEQIKKMKGE
nr:DnaJ domain-containing protein [uncultured Campylobacter sp.]